MFPLNEGHDFGASHFPLQYYSALSTRNLLKVERIEFNTAVAVIDKYLESGSQEEHQSYMRLIGRLKITRANSKSRQRPCWKQQETSASSVRIDSLIHFNGNLMPPKE